MKQIPKLVLFLFMLSTAIVHASALKNIEFHGLKNTSRPWLLGYIRDEAAVGMPMASVRQKALRQRLEELELFERIRITMDKPGGRLLIDLEEKASFLPVPIIAASDSGTLFGVYLGEMNFLGMAKMLYVGGRYATFGTEVQVGYIDPAFISRHFTLSLTMEGGSTFYTQRDTERSLYSRYLVDKSEIVLNLGYRLTKRLQIKYTGSLMNRSVRLDPDNINVDPAATALYQGLTMEFDGTFRRNYLKPGVESSLSITRGFMLDGEGGGHYSHRLSASWTALPWKEHQLMLAVEAGYGNRPNIIAQRIGGGRGFRSLPMEEVTADDFYSVILQYEFPVLSFEWGVFTLLGFAEAGQLRHRGQGWNEFRGFGGGFRMYLRKVAIPAMGFDLCWNPVSASSEFSLSVGMKI